MHHRPATGEPIRLGVVSSFFYRHSNRKIPLKVGRANSIAGAACHLDAIRDEHSNGIPPDDLQIIEFTRQLLRKNRVDEPLAQTVMKRLGADQYVQLTTCIGYYAMLAMTVNACALEAAPGAEVLQV